MFPFSAALKDYYLEAVTAQLNDNVSPFFSAIEKNSANVTGKDVKLTVLRGYAGGIVSGEEDDDLPAHFRIGIFMYYAAQLARTVAQQHTLET